MGKKQFSTANLAIIVPILVGVCTCFYLTGNNLFLHPIIFVPLFFIIVFSIIFTIKIKFPLYVKEDEEIIDESTYDDVYKRDLAWWRCLYCSIFVTEPSKFISFFSGTRLILYTKNRSCKFSWKNGSVTLKHRVFDILLLFVLSGIMFFVAIAFVDHSWGFCTVLFLSFLLYFTRKPIINYSLSVNVGRFDNHKINVVYPYSSAKIQFFEYYGMAILFRKTILITEKTFKLNPIIKEYVLNHENGHLHNFKICIGSYISAVFAMVSLIFIPELLYHLNIYNNFLTILPLFIFFIYKYTIAKYLTLKSELLADEYAIKVLGKQRVLEALNLIQSSCIRQNHNQSVYSLFFKDVSIERRIKFANEYIERQL